MKFASALLLAILYALAVFCICSFGKIKTALSNLLSRSDINYLRERKSDRPFDSRYVKGEVADAVEPILLSWRDADEKELPGRMDKTFLARMQRSIRVLKKYGIRRDLRIFGCIVASKEKDGRDGFQKWNEGGREWREGVLNASLLDAYTNAQNGAIVQDKYYRDVKISILQSRHIRYEDAKQEAQNRKDKFGYMKKKQPETVFYEESKKIICNSCGAELEINAQQVTCPYCGGQLFSDFHDWQTEHFAVEPAEDYPLARMLVCALIAFASSLIVHLTELFVFQKEELSVLASAIVIVLTLAAVFSYRGILGAVRKNRVEQIVRFSKHQFRSCMYEALWDEFKNLDILDFFIGDITIKQVKNTEDMTELTVSAPLFIRIFQNGSVVFEKKKWEGVFTRARYPERLKSKGAIVEERQCPSCASNFVPDEHGCCSFCGYSYRISNAKWKLKRA